MSKSPKKNRKLGPWKLENDNTQLGKGGVCKKKSVVCQQIGHNRKSCPQLHPNAPQYIGNFFVLSSPTNLIQLPQPFQPSQSLTLIIPTQPPQQSQPGQPPATYLDFFFVISACILKYTYVLTSILKYNNFVHPHTFY